MDEKNMMACVLILLISRLLCKKVWQGEETEFLHGEWVEMFSITVIFVTEKVLQVGKGKWEMVRMCF